MVVNTAVTVYEKYNPSVSDIVYSHILYQYWMDSNAAVNHYQALFRTGKGTKEDIRYYEAAVNFNAACTKLLLSKSKNLVKSSDKRLYNKMESWESSIGSQVNYDLYINSCLSNAGKAVDAGTLTIKDNAAVITDKNGTVIDEKYDSTASIAAKFAEIQRMYMPNTGQRWTGNWGGAIQCFGFARMVFYRLFGVNMPNRYYGNARYKYQSSENVELVGQIAGGNVTVTSAKNLLQQGKLGDIIQASGASYGQHTMVFVSADDSGVTVYDCNAHLNSSEPDCVIHQWTLNWNTWANWYGSGNSTSENGISLYRASNYAQIYGDGDGMFYDDSVNFVIENGVLVKYNGWQSFVEIPDTVTAIGDGAFKNNTTMMSVSIPDSVKSIGSEAFSGCTALLGVVIPDSVEKIGSGAFYSCVKLANAYLPVNEKFTVVNSRVFQKCSSLSGINIPDSIENLGFSAFSDCSGLKNVKMSNRLKQMEGNVFRNCVELTKIRIPKSLTRCMESWDKGGEKGEFYGCINLKEIEFEEGVTEIAEFLLYGCDGIEEISIPDTVTIIEEEAFRNCHNLKNIKISENAIRIGNSAFRNCDSLTELNIPDSVEELGFSAFSDCSGLKNVKVSNSLRQMEGNAFRNCVGLTKIRIPKSLTRCMTSWDEIGEVGELYGCVNLKEIEFEDGTTEIAENLFYGCNGIEKIQIPDTVNIIETGAFSQCENLKEVSIPTSVTQIDSNAFSGCTSLTECIIPDSVTSMGDSIFSDCTALTCVVLPSSRQNIGANTFYNCKKLTNVNFPSTLKNIWSSAFYGCESLPEAVLPSGLENIESNAFYGCKLLSRVVVPDTVTKLGTQAFYGCENLTDVTLGTGIKEIGSNTFNGCIILPSIVIPYNVEKIGDSAFVNCTKLTSITIPRATTNIAANAFSYPRKMTIYAPSNSYAQTYAKEKGIQFVAQDIPAVSVQLNVTEKELEKYEEFQLSATIAPANFTDAVVWESSNEEVATVSKDGLVETYKSGKAEITITVGEIKTSCQITVTQPWGDSDVEEDEEQNPEKVPEENKNPGENPGNPENHPGENLQENTDTSSAATPTYNIKKAAISSCKNIKGKKIKIKYKKVAGADGYEISYSTNKKFKKSVMKKTSSKTSYTIKKLKKKKVYYVRVRAYKKDSTGKLVYGKYSSVKKVMIKK